MKVQYKFSPSRLNEYYKHVCARYLAYCGLSNKIRREIGWEEEDNKPTSARLAGAKWEKEALDILERAGEYVAVSDTGNFSREETIKLLKEGRPGYIYQGTLYPTETFWKENLPDLDLEFLSWPDSYPDLIKTEIDEEKNCPVFTVIDMKLAKHAKLSYKAQVMVYMRMLKAILKEEGIPGYVDTEKAYIWNKGNDRPTVFSTKEVDTFVDDFFEKSLPEAVDAVKKATEIHVGKEAGRYLDENLDYCISRQCEWCGNYEHCVSWAEDHDPIMLIPDLSRYAQEYLKKNESIPRSLEGFMKYLSSEENCMDLAANSLFFKRAMGYADNIISAMKDRGEDRRNTLYENHVYAMDMPKYQDVSIVLTAQKDEGTDAVYLYGLSVTFKKEKNPLNLKKNKAGIPEYSEIFIAKNPVDIEDNMKAFTEGLYGILKGINDYNSEAEDDERLSVQGYVMDNYELYDLKESLFDRVLEEEADMGYRDRLLAVLFWMQGERMITDIDEQGSALGVEFPIIVLSNIVRRLYTLPGYISYNLEDISKALSEKYDIERNELYSHPLSNALKSDAINIAWEEKDPKKAEEKIQRLKNYMLRRLGVESSILSHLQFGEKRHSGIKRSAAPFSLVSVSGGQDQRVAKIYIEQLYEELLAFHDLRRVRMRDIKEAAAEGQILHVTVEDEEALEDMIAVFPPGRKRPDKCPGWHVRYKVLNSDVFFLEPWFICLVAEANDEGMDELARVDDRKQYKLPNDFYSHLAILQDINLVHEEGEVYVTGNRIGERPYKHGTELYITGFFKDIAGNTSLEHLTSMSDTDILYPERVYDEMKDENGKSLSFDADAADMEKYARCDGLYFSGSQEKAIKQMFEKNITLLLGPPGTGKTDFIARAVITLCGYYKEKHGRNLSVLVTANSHAAIDNILEKTAGKAACAENKGMDRKYLPKLIKLDKFSTGAEDAGIEGVSVYKKSRPYIEKERRYDNDPRILVLSEYLTAMGAGSSYNPNYDLDTPFVAGATASSLNGTLKKSGDFPGFDIVIIDEASQVRVIDALISLDAAGSDARWLIVGDENQLPPIISGKYEPAEDACDIYGSVFRLFYDTANMNEGCDYLMHLEENFRMNEILDRYPGQKIYDTDIRPGDGRQGYHAFDEATASQKLDLDITPDEMDELSPYPLGSILDPEYPLVLIRISGDSAAARQKAEIKLVTEITKALKEHMLNDGITYGTDEEFWGDLSHKGGFAIISPHHEQINRLKDSISSELGMDRNKLYIGTVDKLQGQEREAVCVSYGISDVEKALGETESIYSMNRLNVSITRGKKKMICILTDALLDKPMELLDLDDEDMLRGISFMCDFEKFMQTEEDDTECASMDKDVDGVSLHIMRKRMK